MMVNALPLADVLEQAGAAVVDEKPEGEFVDLSPEALTKSTIIDLIQPAA